jgi:hypothetical protein
VSDRNSRNAAPRFSRRTAHKYFRLYRLHNSFAPISYLAALATSHRNWTSRSVTCADSERNFCCSKRLKIAGHSSKTCYFTAAVLPVFSPSICSCGRQRLGAWGDIHGQTEVDANHKDSRYNFGTTSVQLRERKWSASILIPK